MWARDLWRRWSGALAREAADWHAQAVAAARRPDWYARHGVADDWDGRFDMICLTAWVIDDRLGARADAVAARRAFLERLIDDFEASLREAGVGDQGVPKRMRVLAEALAGRFAAYDAAMRDADPETALARALERNVFRAEAAVPRASARALALQALAWRATLKGKPDSALRPGQPLFAEGPVEP